MLLGGWLSAEEALAWGLVNRVVPAGQVGAATRELARELAAKSGPASRLVKELVNRGLGLPLPEALDLEGEEVARHMRSPTRSRACAPSWRSESRASRGARAPFPCRR